MELTIDQALQKGITAHKSGQIEEADKFYKAILKANPSHPDANHNMGVLAVGVGKVKEALPFFKAALDANPSTAQFWLSYIEALIQLERITDAQAVLEQAKNRGAKGDGFDKIAEKLERIGSTKGKAGKHQNPPQNELKPLIDYYQKGQFQKALAACSDLLKRFPKSVVLYNISGASYTGLGHHRKAISNYKKPFVLIQILLKFIVT